MKNPIRVCVLHKLPTPYNDMFFRALHGDERIDLQVYHLWRENWRRPWKTELGSGYPNAYMQLTIGVDWRLMRLAWQDRNSFFLVADWGHLASLALVFARYARHAPVGIWADTPQERIGRPPIKRWLRRALLRWLLPRADVVFGTGKIALQTLSQMGARAECLVNLPCFVDLEQPLQARHDPQIHAQAQRLRAQVGCEQSGLVFSMMGTLMGIKAHEIGLQAFAQCKAQSHTPMGLVIAGDGPERQKLEQLTAELRLDRSVAFLGWQEPDEMMSVYLASDIVLHPSRQDPFPLVVLEAMSWSKVIVGSDVCGSIQDRVQHSVNGFSFPAGNISVLAQIITDLVNHPEKLPAIGEQARITAEEWPVSRGVEIVREQAERILALHAK